MGLLLHIGAKNGREKFAIRLGKIRAIHIVNPQVNTAVAQRISVWATRHKQALASVIAGIKNGFVIGNDLGYEKINTPEGKAYLGKLFSGIQGTALRVVVSKKGNLKQRDGGASVLDIAAKKELLGDKMKVIEE